MKLGLLIVRIVGIVSLGVSLACGTTKQRELQGPDVVEVIAIPELERRLTLMVIDDSSASSSQQLREQFAQELVSDVTDPRYDCDLVDPAAWAPAMPDLLSTHGSELQGNSRA